MPAHRQFLVVLFLSKIISHNLLSVGYKPIKEIKVYKANLNFRV